MSEVTVSATLPRTATPVTVPPPPPRPPIRPAAPRPAVADAADAGDRVVHTGAAPRLAALSVVRGAMIAIAAAVAVVDPVIDQATRTRAGAVCAVWLAVLLVGEYSRRRGRAVTTISRAAHLLDGILLTAVTVAEGGTSSPLFFLAFIHVIAVTLLASYATGAKIAIWDSILLLVAAAAETAGAIPFLLAGDGGQAAAAAIRAVALLAVTVVTAGASALNERELRRSRAGLETMLGTGQALMGSQRSGEAMQIALAALTTELDFVSAAVVAAGDDGAPLVARRRQGVETAAVRANRDLVVGVPDGPVLTADPDHLDPNIADLLDREANTVLVPVRGQLVAGVLVASRGGRPGRRGLPVRTLGLVQSLAGQLSQTLDRIALNERIQALASMDGLTGVANRRRFDQHFADLLRTGRETGQPVAVLAIDIDHFKRVNDHHGHQVGDEVLKLVAATLEATKRTDDFLARYGGEEFAIVLPVTDTAGALPIAERLRVAVASVRSPVPVTISVGLAATTAHGSEPRDLFAAADRALYEAKAGGRNRVAVAATGAGTPG